MNKSPNPSFQNFNLDDDWTSHPVVQWIVMHKQTFIRTGLVLLALIIGSYIFISKRTVSREKEIFQAEKYFNNFNTAQTIDEKEKSYQELKKVIDHYPDLAAKYDGPLAQSLLLSGQVSQAKELADAIFKRTASDHLDVYQHYAQTSFLIAEQNYAEALDQAQILKQKLSQIQEQPLANFSTLNIFNLLRLALLHGQLNQKELEYQAWNELNQAADKQKNLFNSLAQTLQIGQASLPDFIEKRLKEAK